MTKYVAFLRGINVGGNRIIRMADLRALCVELGFASVETYVQSGNVIFDSNKRSAEAVARTLEGGIQSRFELEVPVIVRTGASMESIIEANPFPREANSDPNKVHVMFLPARPSKAYIQKINAIESGADSCVVCGAELYLHCPNGVARTKLNNALFERILKMPVTSRNFKSVQTITRMILDT